MGAPTTTTPRTGFRLGVVGECANVAGVGPIGTVAPQALAEGVRGVVGILPDTRLQKLGRGISGARRSRLRGGVLVVDRGARSRVKPDRGER